MANKEDIANITEEKTVVKVEDDKTTNPQEPKKKKVKWWKYALNISIVLLVTALAIFLTVKDNFNLIIKYIAASDYRWLLVVIGVMAVMLSIRTLILFFFARLYTRDYHYHQAAAVEFIGIFYNAVTPGGQGGEVMQAYTYKKQGIQISSAVSALAMHSIVFQLVLVTYGILSFIFKYQYINSLPLTDLGAIGEWHVKLPMWVLTIIGFGLNVGYIGIVLLMGYWKGFHNFVMGPIVSLLAKMRLLKNPDKTRENLRVQVENFKIETRRLFSNVPFTILITICFAGAFTLRFSIPYFVGLALHNESTCASFWDAIFLSNYHQMVTGLIPIPGSAGISEGVFRLLFVTSPSKPETSFFYIAASQAQIEARFQTLLANPNNYTWGGLENIGNFVEYVKENNITNPDELIGVYDEARAFIIQSANTQQSLALASSALLVWRSITFIIPLTIAGLVTAFYHASPKDDIAQNKNLPNYETLVALRQETYSERYQQVETLVETSRLTRESIKNRLKALAKNDRAKKERKRKEKQNQGGYRDVNIDNEDDSL